MKPKAMRAHLLALLQDPCTNNRAVLTRCKVALAGLDRKRRYTRRSWHQKYPLTAAKLSELKLRLG